MSDSPLTARTGSVGSTGTPDSAAFDVAPVHAFYCGNPLCSKPVEPTRKWQRFCCPACRQQASLVRRVSNLLKSLSDDEIVTVIRG
jgi:hypothetical protein